MSKVFQILISSLLLFQSLVELKGQGCSDAGVCTTGELNPVTQGTLWSTRFFLSNTFGLGEQNTIINSVEAGFKINIWSGIEVQARIPYNFVFGELANTKGLGDLIFGLTGTVLDNEKVLINANVSAKIPSGDASEDIDGKPLPMVYQQSLGTVDIIVNATIFYKSWQVGLGYQHARNRNNNGFLHNEWAGNDDALKYWESNKLDRGDDVVLRLMKEFYRPKVTYGISLLPVYRIQNDKIEKDGSTVQVDGSSGLTLNANANATFMLNDHFNLNLIAGAPIVTRAARPDGLTRTFVFVVSLVYTFEDLYELY